MRINNIFSSIYVDYIDVNGGDSMGAAKEEAKKLIDRLPEQATWDDIMYQLYVQKKIDKGLKAVEEGKVISHEEAKMRIFK